MKFILRLLGFSVLSLEIEPPEYELVTEEEEAALELSGHLTTSDHSFGFAPDPLFQPLYWEDDE